MHETAAQSNGTEHNMYTSFRPISYIFRYCTDFNTGEIDRRSAPRPLRMQGKAAGVLTASGSSRSLEKPALKISARLCMRRQIESTSVTTGARAGRAYASIGS